MSENKEVMASDIIDLVVEHLKDKEFLNTLIQNGNTYSRDLDYANQEIKTSYKELQEKLDDYVDQRIMKKLVSLRLIEVVPFD